jgi:hypothetical protein
MVFRQLFLRGSFALHYLEPRLSTFLCNQIMAEIPHLINNVEKEAREGQSRLIKLGAS